MDFLTVEEVANLMKLKKATVRMWIRKGRIKAIRIGTGPKSHWRIPKTEMMRLHSEAYEDKEKND